MPTFTVQVETDAQGHFQRTETFNAGLPFALTVRLTAKLISPAATTVEGVVDVDAADGDPVNPEKGFVVASDQTIDLGSWKLDRADNILTVRGQTRPPRAGVPLVFEIAAAL